MKKNAVSEEDSSFSPQRITMNFTPRTITLKKMRKKEGKGILLSKGSKLNEVHNLPMKHFFQEELKANQMSYTDKIDLIKQSHSKKYNLEYLIGVEAYAHNHVVWNFMYGWYAYTYDNLIIVESLGKTRSQRIITMPQKIGSMLLTNDFKKLICVSEFNPNKREVADLNSSSEVMSDASSDAGDVQEKESAPIYILGTDLSIERKFEFHPKGVQAIALSKRGKYLVSIGNFR